MPTRLESLDWAMARWALVRQTRTTNVRPVWMTVKQIHSN